jgi:dTDP-glucose 4,6-dehydratase
MSGSDTARSGRGAAMNEFLAADFARIGPDVIERCMKIDGARLYLSGATGFFGKNILSLLAYLQRRGAALRVTALSRSPERFFADQPWVRDLKWLDWQASDVLDSWPGEGEHDYLLHAATDTAAEAHLDPLKLFDQIVGGARRALDFAATHAVRRVLLCGSGAQYGAIPESFSAGLPESSSLACDPSKPGSAYGEGKRVSELLAALHSQKHGFSVVSTRCFAFVGPGLRLDGHFAIGNLLRNALHGEPIQLATSGAALRSYLYGADLAVWLLLLLLEAANGSVINVGSDRAVRIIDLAARVRDVVSPSAEVRPGLSQLSGERPYYVPCIASARSLGLEAWTDLDQAIARTALWYRTQPAGMTLRGNL